MDFFARQEKTQARSRVFLFAFVVAALGALFVLYWVVTGCLIVAIGSFKFVASSVNPDYAVDFWQYLPATLYGSPPDVLSFRPIFVVTSLTALFLALLSSLKILRLRIGGGAYVAKSLGGRPLTEPASFQERQLLNVVEEMAVASGLPRPRIYILPRESNINAVTAGRDPDDAVIVVTRGALNLLDRDELQGVVAHEFAHILNDDSALNLSMCGWLFGLLFLYGLGHKLCDAYGGAARTVLDKAFSIRGDRSMGALFMASPVLLVGLMLLIGGWLGKIAAEIFQAAFSRQREYLADAFAVGFTRNPFGLAGALKKIALMPRQGYLTNGQSMAMKSFFIVSPARVQGLFRSHPPLKKRILVMDPDWDGQSLGLRADNDDAARRKSAQAAVNSAIDKLREHNLTAGVPLGLDKAVILPPDREANPADSLALAQRLLASLPEEIKRTLDGPEQASPLIAALFLHSEPDLSTRQFEIIRRILGPEADQRAGNLKVHISDELRLPLLALAAPTLKELPGADRLRLFQAVREMAAVDGRTDFFEVAAFQILRRHLNLPSAPAGAAPQPETLEKAAVVLVSIMAHVGAAEPRAADRAFTFAIGQFAPKPFQLAPRSTANSDDLARALDCLSAAPEAERRRLVSALAAAALSDQVVSPEEYELLRAVAAALDVPLPLFDQNLKSFDKN